MFRPVRPESPKYENITELMVDDDGTAIAFLGRGRSGEMQFEYFDPSIDFKFEFSAVREKSRNATGSPPAEDWVAGVTPSSLARVVLSHPDVNIHEFEATVHTKIVEALLHWPIDHYVNSVAVKEVRFFKLTGGLSLEASVEIALKQQARNG